MPSYEEVEKAIGTVLQAQWTFTPIAFENVPAADFGDVSRARLAEGEAEFIDVEILYNASQAAEVGLNSLKRQWGNLAVDFYVKQDKGVISTRTNLDRLVAIFEWQIISDIVFKDIEIMPSFKRNGWHIVPTMVRFYFCR